MVRMTEDQSGKSTALPPSFQRAADPAITAEAAQQRKAPYDEHERFRVHNERLDRSEQRPHTPAGQIAEALQDAAEYRKAALLYMPDGRPDLLSKDAARDMVAKARSVRLDGPKP